jgi:hypothetical protein
VLWRQAAKHYNAYSPRGAKSDVGQAFGPALFLISITSPRTLSPLSPQKIRTKPANKKAEHTKTRGDVTFRTLAGPAAVRYNLSAVRKVREAIKLIEAGGGGK